MSRVLLKAAALNSIGNITSKAMFFSVSLYLTHQLAVNEYAEYSLLYNLIVLLGTVSAASFGVLITHKVSKFGYDILHLALTRLPICVFVSMVGASIVAIFVDLELLHASVMFIICFSIAVLYSIDSMLQGGLVGSGDFLMLFFGNLIKSLVFCIFSVVLSGVYGFEGAVFSIFTYVFVGLLLNFFFVLKRRLGEFEVASSKEIIQEGFPLFLTGIMVPGFMWLVSMLVYANDGGAAAALYVLVFQTFQAISYLSASVAAPLLPYLNKVNGARAERYNLYFPFIVALVFSGGIFFSKAMMFLSGNDIVNDGNHDVIGVGLLISLVSVVKMSLFRKNVQGGYLYVSFMNNVLWLSLVLFFIWVLGFNVVSVMYAYLYAHLITMLTAFFVYSKLDIINVKEMGVWPLSLVLSFLIMAGLFI